MFALFGKSARVAGIVLAAALIAPLSGCSVGAKSSSSSTYVESGFDINMDVLIQGYQKLYDEGLVSSDLPVHKYAVSFYCKRVNKDAAVYSAVHDVASRAFDGLKPRTFEHPQWFEVYKSAKFDAATKRQCPAKM